MLTIVERGSTHIEWQRRVLSEEADRTGLPVEVPHNRIVERELDEYETADFIAVPSTFVANTFVEYGVPPSKLLINPYGVDISGFFPSGERPVRRTPHTLRVLHVGRVSVQKGVHYLVQASERVAASHLTLVGAVDAGMDSVVRGSQRITAVGAVPGSELPRWNGQADVFCLLSVQEGLALVIAQAMAMGLPVIATPNTGAQELVQDGIHGFIVPARDPDAVAERLTQLAENPALARYMGQQGRLRIEEGFDWSHYGARARAGYRHALEARARRSL